VRLLLKFQLGCEAVNVKRRVDERHRDVQQPDLRAAAVAAETDAEGESVARVKKLALVLAAAALPAPPPGAPPAAPAVAVVPPPAGEKAGGEGGAHKLEEGLPERENVRLE